uniref:Uncharacterized protein n=1 Tax=Rhizophora mucronata TaxID=61149 RepID=A0A2P2PSY7_RHIMU
MQLSLFSLSISLIKSFGLVLGIKIHHNLANAEVYN